MKCYFCSSIDVFWSISMPDFESFKTFYLHSVIFLFQMASKLILGCLALMVVSTYARSSKFGILFCLIPRKIKQLTILLTHGLDIGSR